MPNYSQQQCSNTIILALSAAGIIQARAVEERVIIAKTKATSRPSHYAELIGQGKHLRQKQRTSVVTFSELVVMNATFVCYIHVDRPITAQLRFCDDGIIFLF